MSTQNILLASSSPRRRELLSLTGWQFRIYSVDIDETPRESELPGDYALRLAREKAEAAVQYLNGERYILASDTIVADQNELLGKPTDAEHARVMLRQLRGRTHYVFTAIAVYDARQEQMITDLCAAPVPMRDYSDAELEAYIKSGDPFDKAGAYAIQHRGFHPVEQFRSCFACVMGLPLCHVLRSFRKFGQDTAVDLPVECQLNLAYICPVHQEIIKG